MILTIILCIIFLTITAISCLCMIRYCHPIWYAEYLQQKEQISSLIDENNELFQGLSATKLSKKYAELLEICDEKDKIIKSFERRYKTND